MAVAFVVQTHMSQSDVTKKLHPILAVIIESPKISNTVLTGNWDRKFLLNLLRRLLAQTLPDEAPPVGKIGVTFEPIQQL